jgi:5'-nucleotidase
MFPMVRNTARFPFKSSVLSIASILTLASCAHGPHRPAELDSPPAGAGHDIETIAILGTNDLHGALGPQELKTREPEGTAPIDYKAGGVEMLGAYVNVLRGEFGTSLLWLDAGDEFQGSIESNLDQGAPVVQFYNEAGLQAAAVGNHEFDYGPDKRPAADSADRLGALKARMAEAHYPYLSANITDYASGQFAINLLPALAKHKLFVTGKLKVGVIGLSTLETPHSTSSINIKKLGFSELKQATLQEANALRGEGAQVIVLDAHVGLKCERGRSPVGSHMRKPTEPQGECGPHDEMVRLLNSLPAGTVDAVVAGHSHQIVHHWVAGVPVIEGGAYGRYFNVIYLNYDVKQKKLLTDLTRIEGPVPVCPAVFQNQNDCNGDRPAPKNGRGPLVRPKYHGETLSEDSAVRRLLKPVFEKSAEVKKVVLATAARPIEHERFRESELGDFVTDAMRAATGAQVALMNSGGIRSGWEQGPVTFGSVFRSLPFDNAVVKARVTGKELKLILRIAESGSRGFFSVSGVRMRLVHPDADAPGTDLNGDGKLDAWEVNRMLELRLEDGSEIQDSKMYTLATLDFLLTGGDDLSWIMLKIPQDRQEPPVALVRDAVIQRMKLLAASGPLNTVDHPLIDPVNPRMKFEKPAVKGKGKKGRKGRRSGKRRRK